ncbi:hypothetical protein [Idiomarina ramblicola]|nr:hypothetical protein [Idiomarina ramblicola]
MRSIIVATFIFILSAWAFAADGDVGSQAESQEQCLSQSERERLLNLDENAFDQDLSGSGWRGIAGKTGCKIAAANLIRDYRKRHGLKKAIIFWHEGQVRAMGNDYISAIKLFEKAKKPQKQNIAGWNEYVEASIAFLKRNRHELVLARQALSTVKAPSEFDVQDGVFEIPNNSGKPFKMRWPPNIDVVDGLINCFEESYRYAYGDPACKPAPPD